MKLMLVVGSAIFLLTGCGLFGAKKPASPIPEQIQPAGNIVSSDRVAVEEEQSGNTVTIASVSLDEPGYIVIRDDLFGQPGVIVGSSSLLPVGDTQNVVIPLTVGQSSNTQYYALVHTDDGDQIFRQIDDPVETDANNNPLWVSFVVKDAGDFKADINL